MPIPTYLTWAEKYLPDFSLNDIDILYEKGFVATRIERGRFQQTRSLRIRLADFTLNSENRRILKKTNDLSLAIHPIPYQKYAWPIGKLAKDFYTQKFGDGTFSANKLKELLTMKERSSFNTLLTYTLHPSIEPLGYCVALATDHLLHYCYPFYTLQTTEYELPANLGLGMMLCAIRKAQEDKKDFVYLGSAQRPSDTYKLQFAGLEWFDGSAWQRNNESLKQLLQNLR